MVSATCPACKKILHGYEWTKTKSNKNWLRNGEGQWHSCEKNEKPQKTKSGKSKYPNLWEKSVYTPQYHSCGCCGGNCKEVKTGYWWCDKCDMFPQVTHRRMDEMGNGPKDPTVGPLMTTNRHDITEKFRKNQIKVDSDKIERTGGDKVHGEKPANWMHMKENGEMTKGYKLTDQLKVWFEGEGKSIIKQINDMTVTKKLEKPIV